MADQYEYNEFVPDVHFELIPIKMLVSNQELPHKTNDYPTNPTIPP